MTVLFLLFHLIYISSRFLIVSTNRDASFFLNSCTVFIYMDLMYFMVFLLMDVWIDFDVSTITASVLIANLGHISFCLFLYISVIFIGEKKEFWFFFFFYVYLFERDRERLHAGEEQRMRERKKERERIPSRLCTVSAKPDTGVDLMTLRSWPELK